jgi:hypothetical protein
VARVFNRLRERNLSPEEREAARAQRRADRAARREADNEQSAERRSAAAEAEARRTSNSGIGNDGGISTGHMGGG